MSVDTFKDALDVTKAEPNDDENSFSFVINSGVTAQESTIDPAMQQFFQLGCSGPKFDFTSTLPAWSPSGGCGDSAFGGEKTQGISLMDWNPLIDGDQTVSSWPGSSTPSDHSLFPWDSTPPSSVTSQSQDSHSDINQNELLLANSACKAEDVGTGLEGLGTCSAEPPVPNAETSLTDPNPCDPHTAHSVSTQPHNAPVGWTYRQILEVVALPPPEGLHHWHGKVSQLAVDLGMPIEATGKDIVTFVLHVASVKNELPKVIPLVKALAAAARVLEGRIVAPATLMPVVLSVYPGAVPLFSTEPVAADRPADSNTARKRSHDEMSSETETVPEEEEEEDCEYDDADTDGHDHADADDDADDDTDVDEPTFRAGRTRFTEEDHYCRVDDCESAFSNPQVCMRHRQRHFLHRWVCPGPCKGESVEGGARFARSETLKRHLQFQKNAACMKAVLTVLNLATAPSYGTTWLAPLCDGPERPWESPHFKLTDLKEVKKKIKLRNSGHATATDPDQPTSRRRRHK